MKIIPLAAIDIGSNATRLQITNMEQYPDEIINKKVVWVRVPLRLGEDAFGGGEITAAKRDRLVEAMCGFAHIMRAFNVVNYKAYATSAMRDAVNSQDIIDYVLEKSGLQIEVIDGQTEADIIFESGMPAMVAPEINYLFVDVGGGSTELTIVSDGKRVASKSFLVGTLRMLAGKADKDSLEQMEMWIGENLHGCRLSSIVGSGGNINKVLRLLGKKDEQRIEYGQMKALYEDISSYSVENRIHILKLNPHRADVIVPAMQIFLDIMQSCAIDHVLVPRMGLSEGTIRMLYEGYLESGAQK